MTMNVTCAVTRAGVGAGMPDLDVNDDALGYELVGFSPGESTAVHDWTASAVVSGELSLGHRRTNPTVTLLVRVTGATMQEYEDRRDALFAAFDQPGRYTLRMTIEGQQDAWAVHAGSWAPASGEAKGTDLALRRQTWRITVPRLP